MDEERLSWDDAWNITTKVFAYTNHTTLSEAMETWPIEMFQQLLPRIYMIVHEINERFCQRIWYDYPKFREQIPEMTIIARGKIHMAKLAIVGSFSVNGVAKLHTEILKTREMKYFYQMDLGKFNNKTNGIAHRRWLLQVNPKLASLITEVNRPELDYIPRLVAVNFKNEYKRLKDRTEKLLNHIIYHKFFSSKRLMKHK